MRNFKEYITEGVYDPNIFKAVFLAGGPGSGKSWVSSRALSGMGLKVINSDSMFARALSKEGMGLDFSKYSDQEIEDVVLSQTDFMVQKPNDLYRITAEKIVEGNITTLYYYCNCASIIYY